MLLIELFNAEQFNVILICRSDLTYNIELKCRIKMNCKLKIFKNNNKKKLTKRRRRRRKMFKKFKKVKIHNNSKADSNLKKNLLN